MDDILSQDTQGLELHFPGVFFLLPFPFSNIRKDFETDNPAVEPGHGAVPTFIPALIPGVFDLPQQNPLRLSPFIDQPPIVAERTGAILVFLKDLPADSPFHIAADIPEMAINVKNLTGFHVGHVSPGVQTVQNPAEIILIRFQRFPGRTLPFCRFFSPVTAE